MPAGPVLSLGHAVRRLTLGAGPLKRRSDRVHLLLRVLLAAVLLATPPVGLAAGAASKLRSTATAEQLRTVLTETDAEPLADAPAPHGEYTSRSTWVEARWVSPSGQQVRGRIPVAGGTRAGERVTIWVTGTGARHPDPSTAQDIAVRSTSIGVLAATGLALLAVAAYTGAVALLDRARGRRWADEWAAVEPRWRRSLR